MVKVNRSKDMLKSGQPDLTFSSEYKINRLLAVRIDAYNKKSVFCERSGVAED